MTTENQGCLAAILRLCGYGIRSIDDSRMDAGAELPFRLRDNFLSAAELSFFHVLRRTVGEECIVTTKVRVSDLLYVIQRRSNMNHANRIDRKHVDFVLCDPQTMQPRLVVELDDSSHSRKDRSVRDDLIDAAFAAAGLPVLHVTAKQAYSPDELRQQINGGLGRKQSVPPRLPTASVEGDEAPVCPKCRTAMVPRRTSKGPRKGKRFWGCVNFPDCRATAPID